MIDVSIGNWCQSLLVGLAVVTHVSHPSVEAPVQKPAETSVARMVKHPLGTTQAANGFVEYLPGNYMLSKAKAPLLIAFHGKGENGPGTAKSLDQLNNNGITKMMHQGRWDQPFVTLAPQHEGGGCPSGAEINNFIKFAKTQYRIDENRIYLTGLSCGARGIADYLAEYGGKEIAATVLIAGDLSPAYAERECSLARDLPIWAFHGDADDIVRITGDRATMKRLEACPRHKEMKFDVYQGVGHDSWTRAYATNHHDVYAWMLHFRRDDYRAATAANRH